jgi:hypothetical protein
MNLPRIGLAPAIVAAALLAGCASGVTRMDTAAGTPAAAAATVQPKVKSVNLWLNDDAKKLLPDNLKFNQNQLRGTVERALDGQSLVAADAGQTMDIEITSFRVRSNFSAIMFGFMAGNDNVEGIVSIKDAAGATLKRAKVSASYALGGIGGGQDDARMGWLYEEFAKHTVAELTGVPKK